MGTVRLLQLVAFAAFCLLALKTAGLFLSGGYVLSGASPAKAQTAAEAPESPAVSEEQTEPVEAAKDGATEGDIDDGAKAGVENAKAPAKEDKGPDKAEENVVDVIGVEGSGNGKTESELAVLQSLSKRRIELERRQRELELRENLLKAAEKRVGSRIAELKSIEKRIEKELSKQDDERMAQYMRLVKMYAAMKPKRAAQIFNRLDLDILTAMVKRMRPQSMAKIMAAMDPSAARRLTMELAKSGDVQTGGDNKLPKIGEGGAG